MYIAVSLTINSAYLTADRLMRLRSDLVYSLRNSADSDGKMELDEDETVDVRLFQDGYVVLTRNGISIYGEDGNLYSSHVLQYADPRVKVSDKYILCFDRGGTEWCLLNSFKILCSGQETGDIINGSVTGDGYCAIVSEKFEYKGCVTVYNTHATALSRWNSDSYLLDTFFTAKNEVSILSIASDQEKVNTIFTVLNYKKGEVAASASAPDTMPLAFAEKEGGRIEMMTSSGTWVFDGKTVAAAHTYQNSSPGIYYQDSLSSMLSYQADDGKTLVEAFSQDGENLFTAEYDDVLSLCCYREVFLVLTTGKLYVLNRSGTVLSETETAASASKVLASPEAAILRGTGFVQRLDLSDYV
jgi:hypothetical protein